ncbi:MAG: AMP-binding protein [Actinobacteria bacterium]|nr:AMP-binding protein [Actinomycetota bacterium]
MLERGADLHGDRPLLRMDGLARSYAEMRDQVACQADALARAGIGRGDRVAALCSNRIELLDLILGCAWLGATAVPINTAARGAQLEHVLSDSGARALLAEGDLLEALAIIERPPALDVVWALGEQPVELPGWTVEPPPRPGDARPAAEVDPGDTAAILYTSGTTGPAKGVRCPQAQFHWWAANVGDQLEIGPEDILYTCLPVFHTNALTAFFQALRVGATYHLGERFSASRFWARAAEADATVTYLLGAMVAMLLAQPAGEADRAHRVTRALAPATPANLWEAFGERFGVQLVEGYGSTETNGVIGMRAGEQRPGWMGRVRPGFEARVVDEHDAEVPAGVGGELVLRHGEPFSFATGYHGMPEKTVEAWRNLWFHTGDRVVRDAEGWFRFSDRLKDSIRRRGENISSYEVEQALLTHPAVAGAAVFAVPSELAEDEVAAAIVLEPGAAAVTPEELLRHCEPRLAYFAVPRYVEFAERLPLTENGKVRKAVLRERGVTDATWDREAAGFQLRRGR